MDQLHFDKHVMPSGLVVYFQHRNLPWFQAQLLVDAGRRREPNNKIELAHYVEHIVGSSTTGFKRRNVVELCNWLMAKGIAPNLGLTGIDSVEYGGQSLLEQDSFFFRFLNAFVRKPRFDIGFEHEREAIRNERGEDDQPRIRKAERDRRIKIFGPGPLALSECWAEDDELEALTPDDVQLFYQKNYGLADMKLVVCGGIDEQRLLQLVERHFQPRDNEPMAKAQPSPLTFNPDGRQASMCEHEDRTSVSVVDLEFYWHLPPIATMVPNLLARAIEDQLLTRLREKAKIAYSALACFERLLDHSVFTISTRVSSGHVKQAMNIIERALLNYRDLGRRFLQQKRLQMMGLRLSEFSADEAVDSAISDLSIGIEPKTVAQIMADVQSASVDQATLLLETELNINRTFLQMTEW